MRAAVAAITQEEEFLERVLVNFEVSEVADGGKVEPDCHMEVGMCLRGQWYRLKVKSGTYPAEDPVKSLDVQVTEDFFDCVINSSLG